MSLPSSKRRASASPLLGALSLLTGALLVCASLLLFQQVNEWIAAQPAVNQTALTLMH